MENVKSENNEVDESLTPTFHYYSLKLQNSALLLLGIVGTLLSTSNLTLHKKM